MIKLSISHRGQPGVKMMPVSLSTAFQPLPSKVLEYSQTEIGATLRNTGTSGIDNMYSLGLYGRDFTLDD